MKIKFYTKAELKDAAGKVIFSAVAGDIKDLADDQAARWIRRNAALPLAEAEAKEKAEAEAKAKKAAETMEADKEAAESDKAPKGKGKGKAEA